MFRKLLPLRAFGGESAAWRGLQSSAAFPPTSIPQSPRGKTGALPLVVAFFFFSLLRGFFAVLLAEAFRIFLFQRRLRKKIRRKMLVEAASIEECLELSPPVALALHLQRRHHLPLHVIVSVRSDFFRPFPCRFISRNHNAPNQHSQQSALRAFHFIFGSILVRQMPVIAKIRVPRQIAVVFELRQSPRAICFPRLQIRVAAHRADQLIQHLLGLRRALLRHHGLRLLAASPRNRHTSTNCQRHHPVEKSYPHNTEPPFTLMTSPVMKLARPDAANKIGPAISSAVAGRPSGIAAAAIFCPAFVSSTGFDMSVATHPGATEFTRIPCRASSVAKPFVKLTIAPFEAP